MIRNFFEKIKETKKVATEKNVHNWYNCVFHSVILIMITSMILSLYTIHLFGINLDTTIGELILTFQPGIFLPLFYSITLSYLFLEKLIVLHILAFAKFNKLIFKGWEKFDMWYYRKYRKTSPLTENLAKVQRKISKYQSTKRRRRMLLVGVIIFVVLLNFTIRLPYIMESLENTEQTEIENDSTDNIEQTKEPERKIIVRGAG